MFFLSPRLVRFGSLLLLLAISGGAFGEAAPEESSPNHLRDLEAAFRGLSPEQRQQALKLWVRELKRNCEIGDDERAHAIAVFLASHGESVVPEIAALLELTDGGSFTKAATRGMFVLEGLGPKAGLAAPRLLKLFDNFLGAHEKARVVELLKIIQPRPQEIMPRLIALLAKEDAQRSAADALANLGASAGAALPKLEALSRSPEFGIAASSARAILRIAKVKSESSQKGVAAILSLLESCDPGFDGLGDIEFLASSLCVEGLDVQPELLTMVRGERSQLKVNAFRLCTLLPSAPSDAMMAEAEATIRSQTDSLDAKGAAISVFRASGKPLQDTNLELNAFLEEAADSQLWFETQRWLYECPKRDLSTPPKIVHQLLTSKEEESRLAAVQIVDVLVTDEPALPILCEILKREKESWSVVEAVIWSVSNRQGDMSKVSEELIRLYKLYLPAKSGDAQSAARKLSFLFGILTEHRPAQIRRVCVNALGNCGANGVDVVDILLLALKDPDESVRVAAAEALVRYDGKVDFKLTDVIERVYRQFAVSESTAAEGFIDNWSEQNWQVSLLSAWWKNSTGESRMRCTKICQELLASPNNELSRHFLEWFRFDSSCAALKDSLHRIIDDEKLSPATRVLASGAILEIDSTDAKGRAYLLNRVNFVLTEDGNSSVTSYCYFGTDFLPAESLDISPIWYLQQISAGDRDVDAILRRGLLAKSESLRDAARSVSIRRAKVAKD